MGRRKELLRRLKSMYPKEARSCNPERAVREFSVWIWHVLDLTPQDREEADRILEDTKLLPWRLYLGGDMSTSNDQLHQP